MNKNKTFRLVLTGVLVALVIVLQLFAASITIGQVSFSLVLIPIVLGSMLLDRYTGAFLGGIFGLITLFAGIMGTDPFTATIFQNNPIGTILLCLSKAIIAGYGAGLIFDILKKKNEYVAVFCACAAAPILNTGIFVLGASLMKDTLVAGQFIEQGSNVFYFLIIVCAGINFLVELSINIIFAPAVYKLINTLKKHI